MSKSTVTNTFKIVQGDVILKRVDKLPGNLKLVEKTRNTGESQKGLVVQFSEVTGHHHHFREVDLDYVNLFVSNPVNDTSDTAKSDPSVRQGANFTTITTDEGKYLEVKQQVKMYHGKGFLEAPSKTGVGDHNALVIDPGLYKIDIVREYDYNRMEERKVQD